MPSTRINVPVEMADIIKRYRDLGMEVPEPDPQNVILSRKDRSLEKERSEKRLLKQRVQQLQIELDNAFEREEVVGAIKNESRILRVDAKKTHLSESVVVAVASDWHAEERIDPKTIAGVPNEYNPDIFKRRSERFFSKIVYLTDMVRAKTRVDTLVLCLLGDLINGYIHEEMEEDNYMSPVQASLLIKRTVRGGIDFLLKEAGIKDLIVPCCFGNHGRTTKFRRIGTGAQNSFEWLIYKDLEEIYSKDKRVTFLVADGYHQYLDIYGYILRFHHGDSISYGGGIGGITVPVNKAIANWNRVKRADIDVFGHFHQFIDGGNFICNGSLCGYNAYALSIKAPYERPQQAFFTIDKKHGKTVVCPIIVQDK